MNDFRWKIAISLCNNSRSVHDSHLFHYSEHAHFGKRRFPQKPHASISGTAIYVVRATPTNERVRVKAQDSCAKPGFACVCV